MSSLVQGVKAAEVVAVVVAGGAGGLSGAIDCEGAASIQVITPAAFVTSNLEFHVSHDNVTYVPLIDAAAGTTIVVTALDASQGVTLPAAVLAARFLKIESVTDQTGAVATRTLQVILKN